MKKQTNKKVRSRIALSPLYPDKLREVKGGGIGTSPKQPPPPGIGTSPG